ncbi:ferrous iron transport protein B [Candidatus Williamhamiltonella defendens]|uniref:Ferrous iron transport protein B n=1 Tax=Hamiltonella defensa subsp. Acyrthosiphon pisum (strain 5AT) TaxID=572265 RepID=C4K7C6_HAMD5|nr:Fe(2+) transporter permease subunit FeoB [Candidatus Hamiltonella defensa]ACQ68469.1 ferrous iron transport protein B (FeoB family) [Candidatus Hamiltonella defensa 5AT (Acyrthosiphon pisum)]ATW23016.1 ferrous iron transport protein B [Candidatus Hamiltonella defensa]
MKKLTIGLIGNPNTGKTTLFNQLTGAHQRVGNWAGVTVERKEGEFNTSEYQVTLVDLPGIYSLTTISEQTSLDEKIASEYILDNKADLLINVIDASNLERNLYLTLQLLEWEIPCILALNMLDIAQNQHIDIDIATLSTQLGCPVVPLISTQARGIKELKHTINSFQSDVRQINKKDDLVKYPSCLISALNQLIEIIPHDKIPEQKRRWLALQMLEGDIYSISQAKKSGTFEAELNKILEQNRHNDSDVVIANARYQSIKSITDAVIRTEQLSGHRTTEVLDRFILHRWLGVPLFLFVMYLMFILAINVGGAFQPLFDIGSSAFFIKGTQWLGYQLHFPDWLTVFLAQGIGGGINTMLPLVPQIAMMYLFLSFLEDSGYMARAAFVMDRFMQLIGLPGKSFVPLIVGFGCNVPSIMGARTLEAPRERLITIMMAPFMSCGARLAIFAVFSAAFFGKSGASVVFSLYLLGIAAAILTGLLLKYTLVQGEASPFIMELPIYHVPHLKTLLLQTWQRLKGFVIRAGKVIIMASILIGGLNSFSLSGRTVDNINDSALASVSKELTPLLEPLGIKPDHWQATVGLIAGAMAKEVVVGTLNTLYTAEQIHNEPFDPNDFHLLDELAGAIDETWEGLRHSINSNVLSNPIKASQGDGEMTQGSMGVMSQKFGSDIAAYSYLIFVLLYVPCASVMGAIARETHRGWMIFSILWGLNLAWSFSTLFYQIATFSQDPKRSTLTITALFVTNGLIILGLRRYPLFAKPTNVS